VICMMSISSSTDKIVPKPIQSNTHSKWTYRSLFYCRSSPSLVGKNLSNIFLWIVAIRVQGFIPVLQLVAGTQLLSLSALIQATSWTHNNMLSLL
jgi:hypothetical protein